MSSVHPQRRTPLLQAAAQRVKLAASGAVERTVESLGLAALVAGSIFQRDGLLGAQFELNRKSSSFAHAFNDCLDEQFRRDALPRDSSRDTAWSDLTLVADQEVERQVAAERFGMAIAHACEWELRELDAYMGTLLGDLDSNPLRPEALGLAMLRGIEVVSDRADTRALLQSELGRILAGEMRGTYTAVVGDLRKAGVQPAGLTVRGAVERARVGDDTPLSQEPEEDATPARPAAYPRPSMRGGLGAGPSSRHGGFASTGRGQTSTALGEVDARLMAIIRRLAHVEMGPAPDASYADSAAGLPANLIRAHRDELRQASTGSLDHVVIDVIGTLFDQILSDPKVPPQMARQIARLQLPVLRAALGDSSFFSSRKHPVRRFVNRIASLAAAYDDFDSPQARTFLARVRELVQQIVDGDFDQIELYENKLAELEQFAAEQARAELPPEADPSAVLAAKETELRLGRHYANVLAGELRSLAGPPFVRDFLTEVWSQALTMAAQRDGPGSAAVERLRGVARELFMSVLPKSSPAQRKEFLTRLPRLMQGLSEGMDLIGWPQAARKAFFGLLLPAHAESLKGQGLSTLDFNLLARKVDGVFDGPLPRAEDLPPPASDPPVRTEAVVEPRFSPEEAARIGLVDETKVDWDGKLDIDLGVDEPLVAADIRIDGLPQPEALEPTTGAALADHVQLGFAYRMNLNGEWHKVRLTHLSPGRSFAVFCYGQRHKKTISLTQRMLRRLCESGRLCAYESAYLIERATARARRQLATLAASPA